MPGAGRYATDRSGCPGDIEAKLHDVTASFITKPTQQTVGITPMVIQVAPHVKQGKATKEIAEILRLAPDMIDIHRKQKSAKSWV